MALIESGNLKTLSGPYGTVITAEGHRRGIRDLADPLKVVRGGVYREVCLEVAKGYAQHVDVIATDTFAARFALAAKDNHVPVIVSFVVDATGGLLSGESVEEAVRAVDAASDGYPIGYSLNCCPIDGAIQALDSANGQGGRFVLVYPNASDVDPRLLDGVTEGTGVAQTIADPHARAEELVRLTQRYPNVAIIGGCCGFDHQSIKAIAERVRKVAGG